MPPWKKEGSKDEGWNHDGRQNKQSKHSRGGSGWQQEEGSKDQGWSHDGWQSKHSKHSRGGRGWQQEAHKKASNRDNWSWEDAKQHATNSQSTPEDKGAAGRGPDPLWYDEALNANLEKATEELRLKNEQAERRDDDASRADAGWSWNEHWQQTTATCQRARPYRHHDAADS
eukprot:TRINITY_DN2607_c0_g1_i1.p1 TRINITY_DN2607_c0_g1~~TRINITY_DN2607_c0_g1_i1.p1  ORF type:complete len:172 (-),score=44.74 TRINITY_DN2607_c0_g1_i1:681-1196(-)